MGAAPVPVAHYCNHCSCYYEGQPGTWEALADDYPQGMNIDSVETYTVYQCNDPRGACDLDEDDISIEYNLFKCSDCGEIYEDIADALECCGDE